MITMPLPQLPLSQLPAQNPQRPVTSGHAIRAVSAHSSTRPFAPLSAHCSASLLCSRKVWVTHSAVRCRRRIPRPHHSRRRFWIASTVLTLAFILAWPFTQSTIVLQSPLISSVGSFPATGILSSRGGRSLGCSVGKVPLGSFFFATACFMDSSKLRITSSSRGFFCVISLIRSFPSPAHLAIGAHCTPRLWNPTLCFHR